MNFAHLHETGASNGRYWVMGMQQEGGKTGRVSFADRSADVIAACMEVHRTLGPGLLESAYERCLCIELAERGIQYERQKELPISYKGHSVDASYRIDLVVETNLIVELKAVEALTKVHEAQVITYLKLSGVRAGLLVNFNSAVLRDGLRRLSLTPKKALPSSRLPVASPPIRHE
jgi:GxxExxY protein